MSTRVHLLVNKYVLQTEADPLCNVPVGFTVQYIACEKHLNLSYALGATGGEKILSVL